MNLEDNNLKFKRLKVKSKSEKRTHQRSKDPIPQHIYLGKLKFPLKDRLLYTKKKPHI